MRRAVVIAGVVLGCIGAVLALAWLTLGGAFAGGLAAGIVLSALAVAAGLALLTRRLSRSLETTLEAPAVPGRRRWDYQMKAQTLEGEPFDFAGARDRVLLLNFWATSCPSLTS